MDKYGLSNIETSALVSFIEVADRGSFTEAAVALNLSQPTVSQQVQRLERIVGVKLLHRRSNKVYLSQAGEAFIAYCRTSLQNLETGIFAALKAAQDSVSQVTLGLTSINAEQCLRMVLQKFHAFNPNINLLILEYPLDQLICGLHNQTIDLAWMSSPLPVETLHTEVLYEEPLSLVCSSDHALAKVNNLSWDDICQYPIVLPRQDLNFGLRAVVEELFRCHQRSIRTVIEFGGAQSLRLMLASNVGVAFLPDSLVASDLLGQELVVKSVPGTSLLHEVVIATNPKSSLSPEAESLLETIRSSVLFSGCKSVIQGM